MSLEACILIFDDPTEEQRAEERITSHRRRLIFLRAGISKISRLPRYGEISKSRNHFSKMS
jgi:hypothetical protein